MQDPADPAHLRADAEAKLTGAPPSAAPTRSADELLHELQVHQIELEMQNEALRQAQLDLEESRDRYVDLYEFAPVGYLTLTDTGLIAELNLTGAALLGEDRNKLRHRRFMPFVVAEDQDRWRHFLHVMLHGGNGSCELGLRRGDGSVFDASLDCLLTAAGNTAALRVTVTDISARKQAERALRLTNDHLESLVEGRTRQLAAARDEAERANAAKSHFLAAASHDLRQPLQALHLFIDILKEPLDEARHRKVVDNACVALAAGENLLHALLDVSKFEAGTVMPQCRQFAFSEIAEGVVIQYGEVARAKGLQLISVGSSAVIDSDPLLLSRLLGNLLDNAIKYTERGRILLGCRRIKDGVRIEVWDTGIGITADQQRRIFDEFYQVGNGNRDRSNGLGIGLTVVRRTADLLGHQITVRSWPGRGSVFAVTVGGSIDEAGASG